MNPRQDLNRLARLHGVQLDYFQTNGRHCRASPEILMAVLRSLGSPVEKMDDVPDALRKRRLEAWGHVLPPILVFWDQGPARIKLRFKEKLAPETVGYEIHLEEGGRKEGRLRVARPMAAREVEGERYARASVLLPETLPYGYHKFRLKIGKRQFESLIIAAPSTAYDWPEEEGNLWGLFIPLYALHTERSWGAGDLSDLLSLTEWARRQGGSAVATLPLVPTFLNQPFDPSPYAPVSRLFWNEFYLDPSRAPELSACAPARALLDHGGFQSEAEALRRSPLVDYRSQMDLKRRVLEQLKSCLFDGSSGRMADFERFLQERPAVEDYASFRAIEERQLKPWEEWPSRVRDRKADAGSYDSEARRYHLYVQWLLHGQMADVAQKTRQAGKGLYLDLPLGVSRASYDVWRHRGAFALDASGGAPPDGFFTKGQNWGFPPMHPERIRETGHAYFIDCIRHHLRCAGMLRLDHVMGLNRLFWIPRGAGAADGVYVRYPAEDLYAILCLESRRHRALIVGENLGTVPPYVNASMARHGIYGMYVGQFQIDPFSQTVARPPKRSVASLNTHDVPTFAAFWEGRDIENRLRLGFLDEEQARTERERRNSLRHALLSHLSRSGHLKEDGSNLENILRAFLGQLAAGPARFVLINLEDLWLETEPQNVPGTYEKEPNWRRKSRYSFEGYCERQNILYTLGHVQRLRRQSRGSAPGKQ